MPHHKDVRTRNNPMIDEDKTTIFHQSLEIPENDGHKRKNKALSCNSESSSQSSQYFNNA